MHANLLPCGGMQALLPQRILGSMARVTSSFSFIPSIYPPPASLIRPALQGERLGLSEPVSQSPLTLLSTAPAAPLASLEGNRRGGTRPDVGCGINVLCLLLLHHPGSHSHPTHSHASHPSHGGSACGHFCCLHRLVGCCFRYSCVVASVCCGIGHRGILLRVCVGVGLCRDSIAVRLHFSKSNSTALDLSSFDVSECCNSVF
mmetsp:Transcript_22877/g.45067  ORF Transcript_22877/g.45067 Transcript_22877/m.45067 type:complete len:203 (-) Transcript_22877:189-797(-)